MHVVRNKNCHSYTCFKVLLSNGLQEAVQLYFLTIETLGTGHSGYPCPSPAPKTTNLWQWLVTLTVV